MAARAAEIAVAHLAQRREAATLTLDAPGRKRKKDGKKSKKKDRR
jgi:hypothetical protein